MAELVLTNAFVSVDGTDLSDHGLEVSLDFGRTMREKTAFSETAVNFLAGLKEQSVTLRFNQDFAASKTDAVLAGADDGAVVVLTIRPDAGVVATTNPQWSGNMLLASYAPFGTSVNDVHQATASFQPGDGTGLTRTTA